MKTLIKYYLMKTIIVAFDDEDKNKIEVDDELYVASFISTGWSIKVSLLFLNLLFAIFFLTFRILILMFSVLSIHGFCHFFWLLGFCFEEEKVANCTAEERYSFR